MNPDLRKLVASYGADPDNLNRLQFEMLIALLEAESRRDAAEAAWLEVLLYPQGKGPTRPRLVKDSTR